MVKARGKVTRSTEPREAFQRFLEPTIRIAAWCPDPEAKEKPEQVHFIIELNDPDDPDEKLLPLVLRFKSPDTLGFFIEELDRYRREVWPGAEPVSLGK